MFSSRDDDEHVDTELTRLPSSRTTGTEPAGSNVTLPDTSNRGAVEDCRWEETGQHGGYAGGTVTVRISSSLRGSVVRVFLSSRFLYQTPGYRYDNFPILIAASTPKMLVLYQYLVSHRKGEWGGG